MGVLDYLVLSLPCWFDSFSSGLLILSLLHVLYSPLCRVKLYILFFFPSFTCIHSSFSHPLLLSLISTHRNPPQRTLMYLTPSTTLTHSLTLLFSLIHILTRSFSHSFNHSHCNLLTHTFTYLTTRNSFTHSLTHSTATQVLQAL